MPAEAEVLNQDTDVDTTETDTAGGGVDSSNPFLQENFETDALPGALSDKESVSEDVDDESKGGEEVNDDTDDSSSNKNADEVDDENTIASITDLAEDLGVEEDDLLDLKVAGKVDGKPIERTFRELLNVEQTQEAANRRLEESKESLQEAKEHTATVQGHLKEQVVVAAAIVKAAESLFGEELSAQDLEALKAEKGEQAYLLAKDQQTTRREALNQVKQQVGAAAKQLLQQASAPASEEDLEQQREEQTALLYDKMPALSNKENRDQLIDYILDDAGFTVEEMKLNPDHRLYMLAEKARQFDALQAKGGATRKRLRSKTKTLKGKGKTQQPSNSQQPKSNADVLYS